MPNKTQEYLNLAQQTAKELTRYWENWTDYLTTASRLYKYSYADQLMIYAQRPDATACASFDLWNNRMNRYVRHGSKGIALLDQSSSVPRLHYVFDVSDTGVRRNSRDPEVWQLGPDLVQPVSEMLAREYGVRHERITQQIADICGKLVDSYWDNNSGDILDIVDGSFLMDYDEAGQEFQFKSAAAISITYAVLERCGFEPEGHFDRDDFQAIFSFSTPAAVYALGTAVSECSRDVLRNIERTVKTTIRRRNVERSQYEYEQQERDLLDHRGLSAPEPDPAPAGENTGQVRATAPDLPDEASPGAVQLDASVGNSASAPVGGGANRREPDAADHAGVAETEPGSEQGAVSDGVGAAHEQPESTGRGTGDERADLQLSFFDAHIPTEAEQIESIDQAESEKSPSAFVLSQAEIENALRRGSNFENSKLRIWKIYQLQPDRKLRAKALAKEYAPNGPGGSSHTYLDGSSGWLDHDSKGLTFEHYPDHQKVLLRWDRVEKYIDLMIQSNRYLSDKERRAIDFPLELNAASAAEYTALKAQHPDTLVGFEAGGNFMFYAYIAGVKADAELAAVHPQEKEGFCGITIKGVTYDEKKTAGERLLLACSELPNSEEKVIGSYRGFELSLRFDTYHSEYQALLKGQRKYPVALGKDPLGCIIRLDNSLNNFPERITSAENELATLKQQQEAAQIEVEKPFPQEEELAEKSARLAELNAQLDMDEKGHEPEQDEEEQEDEPRRPSVLAALEEKADKTETVKPFKSFLDKDGDAR